MEILLYAVVFAAIGVVVYFADYRFGSVLYRKGYNLWHKHPLPLDVERGFIVGRTTRERFFPAVVLTVLACFILHRLGEHDVITLLLKGAILMLPELLIGFLLTGLAMREGKTRTVADKVFKVMDQIESGEVDLSEVAHDALEQAEEIGKKVLAGTREKADESVVIPPVSPAALVAKEPAEEISPAPVQPKKSFKDTLNDYGKRR